MTMDLLHKVSSFLYFGYLPHVPSKYLFGLPNGLNCTDLDSRVEKCNSNESEIIEEGVQIWKDYFQRTDGDLHIIPLSGGLDSRAVLGGLIDAGLKDRIVTITFGTPGTLDYELGRSIAVKLGLSHECIDLTTIEIDQQLLLETAQNGASWTFLIDAFYNSLILKKFGTEAIYWTGYMGDALTGAHLPPSESVSWQEAKRYFATWNDFLLSHNLTPPGFTAEDHLPPHPFCDQKHMSYDDQLDFYIRQQCYIRRVIIPQRIDCRAPFLAPEWIRFILGIPFEYRVNQYIYKKILLRAYPDLFRFPTTNMLGLPLSSPLWQLYVRRFLLRGRSLIANFSPKIRWLPIDPRINYIDFNNSLRDRNDMKTLVQESIRDLKKRGLVDWLDLDSIWQDHQNRRANHGNALMLLTAY